MKKLSEYTVEELLLIYFNQSNVNRQPKLALDFSGAMQSYGDYFYSDYLYSDSNYGDSDSTISDYSNSDYSNSDYLDSSYGNSLYSEYDAYSGPGGRFYTDYEDYSNYSDYDNYDYSDYSDYSYSDYADSVSSSSYKAENTYHQLSPDVVRSIRAKDNPLHSFWFVAACLSLLSIPLIELALVSAYYSNPSDFTGFVYAAIVIGIHLLGFGLGVFIPKMVHHAEFIDDWGYGKDPLKCFSFVVAILLIFTAVIYGIVVPTMAARDPQVLGADKVYPAQYVSLFIGAFAYLLTGIIMIAYKANRHKRYKTDLYLESTERKRAKLGRYTIVKKYGDYISSINDIESSLSILGNSYRIILKNNNSGQEIDYELLCCIEKDEVKYILVSYIINGGNDYKCYEINLYSNCLYPVEDQELQNKLFNLGVEKLKERNKALEEEITRQSNE